MYYLSNSRHSLIHHPVFDQELTMIASTPIAFTHNIVSFIPFRNCLLATMNIQNVLEIWNTLTNDRLHSFESFLREFKFFTFTPNPQYIILYSSNHLFVFSNLTFALLKEIDQSAKYLNPFTSFRNGMSSFDDDDIIFFNPAFESSVLICNIKTGSLTRKDYPNQDAHDYRVYQGIA